MNFFGKITLLFNRCSNMFLTFGHSIFFNNWTTFSKHKIFLWSCLFHCVTQICRFEAYILIVQLKYKPTLHVRAINLHFKILLWIYLVSPKIYQNENKLQLLDCLATWDFWYHFKVILSNSVVSKYNPILVRSTAAKMKRNNSYQIGHGRLSARLI